MLEDCGDDPDWHFIAPTFRNIKNNQNGLCGVLYKEYALNFREVLDGAYEFFQPMYCSPILQCTVCSKNTVLHQTRITSTNIWAYLAKDQFMQLNLLRFFQLATVIHCVDKIQSLCDDCQAAKMKFESLLNQTTFLTEFAAAEQAIYQDHKAFYAAQCCVVKKFQDLFSTIASTPVHNYDLKRHAKIKHIQLVFEVVSFTAIPNINSWIRQSHHSDIKTAKLYGAIFFCL